ncbi:MAG TPA: purine-nucleoside phosphorylase [Actinomycetota bacterium]
MTVGPGDDLAERGAEAVRAVTDLRPQVAVIAGSGLGDALDAIEPDAELAFSDLPGFPLPSVPGHAGRLVVGTLAEVPVAGFLGRVHFYEGHPMPLVTLPARLAAALGAGTLVVTASTGGLDPDLEPGSLVIASDHLNLLGENPLRGWRDEEGRPVFVDLTRVYPPGLAEAAERAAREVGLPFARGVYAAMPGPTYETPSEAEMLRRLGGDVVGMSVVPEACAAAALGMRCLGLFCVTNRVGVHVSHEEVTRVAARFADGLRELLRRVLPALGEE